MQNVWTYVQGMDAILLTGIIRKCTVSIKQFRNGRHEDPKTGRWVNGVHWVDVETCLFDSELSKFPTGLFWEIFPLLPADAVIKDERFNKIEPVRTPEEVCQDLQVDLRDYQLDSIRTVHRSVRGILNIATNGGKTEMLSILLKTYPECCTLIVTAELTGVMEICERFDKRGIGYSTIDSGSKEINWDGVNICSLASLVNLEELDLLLKKAKILIWDECDDSTTQSQGDRIGFYSDAYVRIYLSGTPFVDDPLHNLKVVAMSGPEIVNIRNKYLIDRGFSATPTVVFHSSEDRPIPTKSVPYQTAVKDFINSNENFARRLSDLVKKHKDEGCVVLYEHTSHGRFIRSQFETDGLRPVYIDGGSSQTKRKEAMMLLKSGAADVILASSIWNRALDFGFPQHWFFVGGMKASNRVKQKYGRALRKKPNAENRVWIHEWFIWGSKNLIDHCRQRYRICVDEGFSVEFAEEFIKEPLQRSESAHKKSKEARPASNALERLRANFEHAYSKAPKIVYEE